MKNLEKWSIPLALSSGFLYFFPFLFPTFFFLSWLAFVPLLLAIQKLSYKKIYFLGFICGSLSQTAGVYWMSNLSQLHWGFGFPLNYLFLLVFGIGTGNILAVALILFHWLRKNTNVSELLLFPSCLVFVYLPSFATFNYTLGDTQAQFLSALQAIEWTGIEALTWLMGLSNVLVYKLLFDRKNLKKISWQLCLPLFVVWFSWGIYAQNKWQKKYSSWQTKKIALVQPNRKASLFYKPPREGFSKEYPLEMELMEKISPQNPVLAIWPEGNTYSYQTSLSVQESFQNWISFFRVATLFIDNYRSREGVFNSMYWLNDFGIFQDVYHKRALVPFGEYLPLYKFYGWLLGDFSYGFTAGKEAKVFDISGMRIVPLICFESIVPKVAAQSVGADGAGKVFVVASQNGWYKSRFQVTQHSNLSRIRAVENRLPLLHSINNGPSSLTMPDGKILFKTPYQQEGAWVVNMPFDKNSGGSFYSKHYNWFTDSIKIFIFGLIFFVLIRMLKKKITN